MENAVQCCLQSSEGKMQRRNRNRNAVPGNDFEKFNFARVFKTFESYREQMHKLINRKQLFVENLPPYERVKLSTYLDQLQKIRPCLDMNSRFVETVIRDVENIFCDQEGYGEYLHRYLDKIQPFDLEALTVIFKQLVREWSREGGIERWNSFSPIIHEIRRRFNVDRVDPSTVKILFPGAGLGRLPYEVARLGYNCEGNEHSLFMSFVSNFIMNRIGKKGHDRFYPIHPFIHSFDNIKSNADQLFQFVVPDILPEESSSISMSCGDFVEVYSNKCSEYDCVATSFFMDCPPNALIITDIIYQILKPGGYWINNGPLKYHFNGAQAELSIQLSQEDLKSVILKSGFDFKKEEDVTSSYFGNPKSMWQSYYHNWHFVCRKPFA